MSDAPRTMKTGSQPIKYAWVSPDIKTEGVKVVGHDEATMPLAERYVGRPMAGMLLDSRC